MLEQLNLAGESALKLGMKIIYGLEGMGNREGMGQTPYA